MFINYGLEAKERLLNRNTPNQHGIEQCGGMLMDVVVLVVESKGGLRLNDIHAADSCPRRPPEQ